MVARNYPKLAYINAITNAKEAVITFTEDHDFTIGEINTFVMMVILFFIFTIFTRHSVFLLKFRTQSHTKILIFFYKHNLKYLLYNNLAYLRKISET